MRHKTVTTLLDSVWECLFACARKIVEAHASVLLTLACANRKLSGSSAAAAVVRVESTYVLVPGASRGRASEAHEKAIDRFFL